MKSTKSNKMAGISSSLIFIIFLLITIFATESSAQNPHDTDHKADKNLKSSARVNPSTLAMEFTLPLANFPGRAGNGVPLTMSYSSKVWTMKSYDFLNPTHTTGVVSGGGTLQNPNQIYNITSFLPEYAERSLAGWNAPGLQPIKEEWDDRWFDFKESGSTFLVYVKRVRIIMPDGSSHEFRKDDKAYFCAGLQTNDDCSDVSTTGVYLSVDGSGLRFEQTSEGNILYMPDGGRYFTTATPQVYIDRNGNKTTFDTTTKVLTDTLGREISSPLGTSATVGSETYSLPAIGSSTRTITKTWQVLKPSGCAYGGEPACADAGLENPSEELYYVGNDTCELADYDTPVGTPRIFYAADPPNSTTWGVGAGQQMPVYFRATDAQRFCSPNAKFNPVVLTEVTMPDGNKYEFRYNRHGEMTKIVYPTGAYERFTYQELQTTTPFPFSQTVRGVSDRWVSEDGITETQHWQYSTPQVGNVTTIENDGTKTVSLTHVSNGYPHGFENPKAGMPYDVKVYSKPSTPGNESTRILLRRELTEWTNAPPRTGGTATWGERDARPTKKISIIFEPGASNALAQLTETVYDSNSDQSFFAHLNATQIRSHKLVALDLNTASTGTLTTIAGYFSNATLASVSEMDYLYDTGYKSRGILGLPTETRLFDARNNNALIAKSQALYDEVGQYYSMIDSGSTTGYIAPTGAYAHLRGKPTTKRTWNFDTNSWIETHTQFDNFGNVRKVWDTSGDQSRFIEYEYDPQYKYAYVTKTKAPAPDPTGIHGMTAGSEITETFDFNTGLSLSVTDANGQTAATEYDGVLRPIRITPPSGGSISETVYNDNERWVKSRQQIDDQNWAESTTFFDLLGRPIKTKTKDLQGDILALTEYDNLGRVSRTSNPYREGETAYWSKPRYDLVGRVVETFAPAPDGQTGASLGTVQFGIVVETGLIGTYQVSTDASGRKRRVISGYDGITRVDEPTAMGGSIDQDLGSITNPNQPTSYGYNTKGELTKITQGKSSVSGQPFQNRFFLYDSFGRLIRVRQPEQIPNSALATTGNPENNQWTAAYSYDVVGNVISMTDAKNTTITTEYDKAGRTVKRTYSDGTPQSEFFYDGTGLTSVPAFSRGSITKATNGVSEDRFTEFDNHGRLRASQQLIDGQTFNFQYRYNLSSSLVEEIYPSGRIVRNSLDQDGGLSAVTSKAANTPNKVVASNFDYSAAGGIRKMKLGNGLWETAQVNERFQLTQVGLGTTATNNDLFKIDYEYGEISEDHSSVDTTKNVGMIARTTTTIPTTSYVQTYKYDSIARLKEAKEKTGTTTNWQQTFGYDIFGNRTSFSQTVGSTTLPTNSITKPTVDPANNRFTTGQGYVYDLNGNLIQDAEGRGFTFDGNDKQTVVRDLNIATNQQNPDANVIGRYYYDASGARVKKVTNTETTVFVYDAAGALAAEYSTQAETVNPQENYLTTDHLGSPRVITDKNGNVVSRRDFMPFGEEIGAGVGTRTTNLKYTASGYDNVRKRYTGYEKDSETGLDFAEARMYQNKHGRFTAVDPLMASASPGDPQTFNRFSYTGNNPINRTDSSGLKWCSGQEIYWNNGQCYGDDEDITRKQISVTAGCAKREGSTPVCIANPSVVYFDSNGSARVVPPTPQQPINQNQTVAVGTQAVASTPAGSTAAATAVAVTSSGQGGTTELPRAPASEFPAIFPCSRLIQNCSVSSSSGTLDTSQNEPLKVVEGIAELSELGSAIPGLNVPFSIIAAVTRAGQGNFGTAGINLAMVIPFTGEIKQVGKVANVADDIVRDARRLEGIYEFVASSGKTYVGQSKDIAARIEQHIASGKMLSGTSFEFTEIIGGKEAREIAEQLRINSLGGIYQDGVRVLENIRNPIGRARKYLLP